MKEPTTVAGARLRRQRHPTCGHGCLPTCRLAHAMSGLRRLLASDPVLSRQILRKTVNGKLAFDAEGNFTGTVTQGQGFCSGRGIRSATSPNSCRPGIGLK